jgi:hypothetical protein
MSGRVDKDGEFKEVDWRGVFEMVVVLGGVVKYFEDGRSLLSDMVFERRVPDNGRVVALRRQVFGELGVSRKKL